MQWLRYVLRACIDYDFGLRASSDYIIGLRACSGVIVRSSREVFGTVGRPNIGFSSLDGLFLGLRWCTGEKIGYLEEADGDWR